MLAKLCLLVENVLFTVFHVVQVEVVLVSLIDSKYYKCNQMTNCNHLILTHCKWSSVECLKKTRLIYSSNILIDASSGLPKSLKCNTSKKTAENISLYCIINDYR